MMTRKLAILTGFLFTVGLAGCGVAKNSKTDATPSAPAPGPAKIDDSCANDVSSAYVAVTSLLGQITKDSGADQLEKASSACDKFENMIRSSSCQIEETSKKTVTVKFDSKIENACRSVKTNLAEIRRGGVPAVRPTPTSPAKPPVVTTPATPVKPPVVTSPVTPTAPVTPSQPQPPQPAPTAPATPSAGEAFDAKKDFKEVTFKVISADLLKKATLQGSVAEVSLIDGKIVRDIQMVTALDAGKVACWLELGRPVFKKDELAKSVKIAKDSSSGVYHETTMYLKFANGKIGALTCANKEAKDFPTPKQIRAALRGALEVEASK